MSITLPTKPQVISEEGFKGTYSIENLYPGYGHTLGNSLRRIMLSSIPGVAVTTVKIDDVAHEFSTIDGVSEDVVSILLNLKKCVFRLEGVDEAEIKLTVSGDKKYTAADIVSPSEVKIISKDAHILTVTDKKAKFEVLITLKRGIGYVAKENINKKDVIPIVASKADFFAAGSVSFMVSLTPKIIAVSNTVNDSPYTKFNMCTPSLASQYAKSKYTKLSVVIESSSTNTKMEPNIALYRNWISRFFTNTYKK
jgi:DNA-directed RNA polymerase subunit L